MQYWWWEGQSQFNFYPFIGNSILHFEKFLDLLFILNDRNFIVMYLGLDIPLLLYWTLNTSLQYEYFWPLFLWETLIY